MRYLSRFAWRVLSGCCVLAVTALIAHAQPLTFTTFAGPAGGPGSADGAGNAARFNLPEGVATDSAGNVYVADTFNDTIRKITPAGVVTTLAGSAADFSGSANGTGSAARFYSPTGVATDRAGNVYVADRGNFTIRKITAAGVVATLAGLAGQQGTVDGTGSAARFYAPAGVATDSAGNVYVTDSDKNTIRKITAAGVVTTLAGSPGLRGDSDGIGGAARFNFPNGVATDGVGNIYVADSSNNTIRKITPAGVVTTLAGSAGELGSEDGTGSAARFWLPGGVATDSGGNVYVADTANESIRKITPAGVVTTLAGSANGSGSADGIGGAARFNIPTGVATDSIGNVYVADRNSYAIRKVTPAGVVTTLAGSARDYGSADGTRNDARFGGFAGGPSGLATDSSGNVYVADPYNATIRMITPSGVVTTMAGSATNPGSADGTGSAARFALPTGVATDGAGTVYVADTANNTIRKITAAGVVTTLAGSAGHSGSADGTGSVARFNSPTGVAADSAGNVYVADTLNHTIRKITSVGVVTTMAAASPSTTPAATSWSGPTRSSPPP